MFKTVFNPHFTGHWHFAFQVVLLPAAVSTEN